MSAEKHTLRMWLIFENERSLVLAEANRGARREVCLPRSLIDRLTKFPRPPEPLSFQPVEFTLPEWKVEEQQLWDCVVP